MTSSNPFDQLVDNSTNLDYGTEFDPNFNPFSDYYREEQEKKDEFIKAQIKAASSTDPDKAGKAQKLVAELGLPDGMALDPEKSLKFLEERKKQQLIDQRRLSLVNPILGERLRNPSFAQIAHDNIENLGFFEKLYSTVGLKGAYQGTRKGILSNEKGKLGSQLKSSLGPIDIPRVLSTATQGDFLNLSKTDQEIFDRIKEIDEEIARMDADGENFIEAATYYIGQYGASVPQAALTGLATAKIRAKLGATVGSAGGPKGSVIGGVLGGLSGWGAFTNKLALDTVQVEEGHAYLELLDRGYTKDEAQTRAQIVGVVNGALERVNLALLGKVYKGAKDVAINQFNKRILRRVTVQAMSKNAQKATQLGALKALGGNYVTNIGSETGTEVLQELVSIAGVNVLSNLSQEDINTLTPEQIGDRVWSTMTQTMKGMVLFGLVGSGGSYVNEVNKVNQAKSDVAFIEKLSQVSANDKTKKRNATVFQNYIQQISDSEGVDDFYIDAGEFLNQLDKNLITEQQLELFSPDISKQIKDIKKEGLVGKDIKIKTGDYAANIAGTEFDKSLQPHLRLGADSLSLTDYSASQLKNKQEALDKVVTIMNEQKNRMEQAAKEEKQIKRQIAAQLKVLNTKFTENDNRFLAGLPSAFAGAYSKLTGQTPKEFINQHFYNIKFDKKDSQFGSQLFNQDGTIKTETEFFKNWFGKSIIKNPDGTPMVVYHGTTDSFDQFDLDHPNKYDNGFLGKGIYLTDREELAQTYATNKKVKTKAPAEDKKVMPLYVRLENPYLATAEDKNIIKRGGAAASAAFRDKLIREGYDGAIMEVLDGREIVVFDTNAVKSVDNQGNWSRELDNLYEQQQVELENEFFEQQGTQKQGKVVPETVKEIANLIESFDFAGKNTFETNRDFKLALQQRVKDEAKKAGVDVSVFTAEVEKYLVNTALADARYALENNDNAIGWYDTTLAKAKGILSLIHPELETDPVANFAFVYALANTSNMIKVDRNLQLAETAYTAWQESRTEDNPFGTFPEKTIGEGDAKKAINRNFKMFNKLIREKGFEALEQYLGSTHLVKDIEDYTGSTVTGLNKSDTAYGAAIMGPKIGNGFYANLKGHYEQLTMDRWLIRSWGRMTGTLVLDYTKQAKVKRGQLKSIIKGLTLKEKRALEEIIKTKVRLSNLDEVAVAIQKASTSENNRDLMNAIGLVTNPKNAQLLQDVLGNPRKGTPRVGLGSEIRKGGNALAKFLDGQKETPSGAPERRNITKVFEQVLSILQQEYKDLTMADLQALLWYPEKRLYDTAKLDTDEIIRGYEESEAPDYANASAKMAVELGVSEADIQIKLKEVNDELQRQAANRTTGTQRDVGGTGSLRGANTFQQQGADSTNIDERTGLPLNPDGTVTVYHHTNKQAAKSIRESSELRSLGEPDVYVTTRAIADTGYGDTSVGLRVDPSRLSLDDEFPNGRRDYRLSVGRPRGSIRVDVIDLAEQSKLFSQNQIPQGPRGRFNPRTLTTLLTKEADFSTFAHETAHYMLTVLENIVTGENAPSTLISDFDTLLDFWGVKDIETWKTFDLEQKRKYHEQFAYNYEIYLHENKAPSTGLRKLFQRFSYYIKKVYEDVRGRINDLYRQETGQDLPMLTDEVRSVMDRMLASDEQIIQANDIYDMRAMFETQETSGMNNEQWAEYTAALKEAEEESLEIMTQDSMRQVRWLNNSRQGLLKKYQKDTKKLYKKVEAEEQEKVKQEKIYKLAAYLKRGETVNEKGKIVKVKTGHKLSIESLSKLIPFYDMKSEIKELTQKRMATKKGVDVKLISEMFGFKTATDMVDALLEMQPIEDRVQERTEQRMIEEFSNLLDPRQQELKVQEAIHNEARARFISAELRFLSKSMQPVRLQLAAAKQVAEDILAKKKLSEIRPTEFARAEARALKAAEAAMKKGDSQAALEAKRSQLLNNQLAKTAIDIQKRYDAAKSFFVTKLFKKSDSKIANTRNTDLVNAARAIMSSYGVGPVIENPNDFTKKLETYDPQLYAEIEPIILDLQASNNQKSLTDLSTEDFDYVYEMVQSLWHQSLRDEQVRMLGKLQSVEEAATPLIDNMKEKINKSPRLKERQENPPGARKAIGFKYQIYKMMLGFKAKLRRMEHWVDGMDGADQVKEGSVGTTVLELKGGKLGKFYNTLWFPMKDALTKYREQQLIFTKEYSDLIAQVDFGNDSIFSGELNYDFGTNSNARGKVELLGAMLHTGNKSNLRKLLLGRKWGELNEDGSLNTTRWDTFVERMINEGHLTENDYVFLQAVWDLNEKMKPLLQKAHKETEGYYFKEVEATPITNRFGTYRGGYVPAKTDPLMVDQPVDQAIETTKLQFKNSLPSAPKGMTKSRVENYAAPLSLHLGYMTKHIDDSLRFAYVQPVLKDTLKILKHKDFEKTLEVIDPTVMKEMILPWLQTAANQTTFTPSGLDPNIDKLLVAQRRRAGIGIMFANISNAIQQYTGIFPANLKVKGKYLNGALVAYTKDRQGIQEMIAGASPFMEDRQRNQMFDIQGRLNELIIDPNQFQKFKDWSTKHAYFLQQTFQNQVDAVVWLGTFNQVHAELGSELTNEEVLDEAIKQADANVRLTQDSLLPEDRAAFQNSTPIVQAITQFTGYFNTMANLNATQFKKLIQDDIGFKNKSQQGAQMLYTYIYSVFMPAVVAGLIARSLGGNLNDDDDDGYLDDVAEAVFGDVLKYKVAFIPIVGQAAIIPINALNDLPYDDTITSSPSFQAIEQGLGGTARLLETLVKGEEITGRQIRDISSMLTQTFGVPITPFGKSAGYLRDVQRGEIVPDNPIDFIRGLITGKRGRR